jgi:poly(hydroxyalkanoate) granule-associated protein
MPTPIQQKPAPRTRLGRIYTWLAARGRISWACAWQHCPAISLFFRSSNPWSPNCKANPPAADSKSGPQPGRARSRIPPSRSGWPAWALSAKAQEEGGKVFEALVKEGTSIQRKTQAVAEEKDLRGHQQEWPAWPPTSQSKASGNQWDKLETIFEDRVAKALNKLGVPSAKDVDALIARIDELNRNVQKMSAKAPAKPATKTPAKTATKPATKKAAAKRPAARKTA